MSTNRPSLDEIFNQSSQTNTQGNRPSLDQIFNQSSPTGVSGVLNMPGLSTSSVKTQPSFASKAGSFVTDVAGSVLDAPTKIGNTFMPLFGLENQRNIVTDKNVGSLNTRPDGTKLGAAETLLNTAGTVGEGLLNVYAPSAGASVVRTAQRGILPFLKRGIITGAPLGAGVGASTGLQEVNDASDLGEYGNVLGKTALYGAGGTVLGLLGGGATAAYNKVITQPRIKEAFTKVFKEGADPFNDPVIVDFAKRIGAETPEKRALLRDKNIALFEEELRNSSRGTMQPVLADMLNSPEKKETLGTVLDNISYGIDTAGTNKVDWAETINTIKNKERLFDGTLKEITDAPPITVTTANEFLNIVAKNNPMKTELESNKVLSSVDKLLKAQAGKKGYLSLQDINAIRADANANWTSPESKAISQAIKELTGDILGQPEKYGIEYGDDVYKLINDNDVIWREYAKLKQANAFLNKWRNEILIKNQGLTRQLVGGLGYAGTNSFLGYLAAAEMADNILTTAARAKIYKLYGNPLNKSVADQATKELKDSIRGTIDNIFNKAQEKSRQALYKEQEAVKKQAIQDIARSRQAAIDNAKYSPPNQELYEPYIPDSELPVIDFGTPSPKKPSTEPYIDAVTNELVDPKKASKNLLKSLAVVGGAGTVGSQQANAMQQGTPAQAPRHKNNPLVLNKEQKENIKTAIAGNESLGEENPYEATNTQQSAHGVDFGRFQFSDSLRKELTKLYFGKEISKKDLTPALQEELMDRHIDSLLANGFSVGQIFRIHRKGLRGMMSDTAMEYGEEALAAYNKLEAERIKKEEAVKERDFQKGNVIRLTPELKKILKL
ncbi:hypothetical protein EKK58_06170 [Candidatus Dependentiae bacterium]|nr:MAG: hypothetical protein EKK58_06170 [Candidatus Dependentiae bacterium]